MTARLERAARAITEQYDTRPMSDGWLTLAVRELAVALHSLPATWQRQAGIAFDHFWLVRGEARTLDDMRRSNVFISKANNLVHARAAQWGHKYAVFIAGAGDGGCAKFIKGFSKLADAKAAGEMLA